LSVDGVARSAFSTFWPHFVLRGLRGARTHWSGRSAPARSALLPSAVRDAGDALLDVVAGDRHARAERPFPGRTGPACPTQASIPPARCEVRERILGIRNQFRAVGLLQRESARRRTACSPGDQSPVRPNMRLVRRRPINPRLKTVIRLAALVELRLGRGWACARGSGGQTSRCRSRSASSPSGRRSLLFRESVKMRRGRGFASDVWAEGHDSLRC